MSTFYVTKDPSHKGYYKDDKGRLYVFRFGGKPIRVDSYREDKPREMKDELNIDINEEDVIDHSETATEQDNKEYEKELQQENTVDNKYVNAKLQTINDNKVVQLENGEIVSQLNKKEYKQISEDFANSLSDDEIKFIDSYVASPGISGDLNAKDNSTKYYYNTSENEYFVNKNELNKYYYDLYEKYKEAGSPQFSQYWPDKNAEAYSFIRKELGDDISIETANNVLSKIQRTAEAYESPNIYSYKDRYFTDEEIADAKERYTKLKSISDEMSDEYMRNGYSDKYRELEQERNNYNTKDGVSGSEFFWKEIAEIKDTTEFNFRDYDIDEARKKDLVPMSYSDLLHNDALTGNQSSDIKTAHKQTHDFINKYNEIFDKKAVKLDYDILVFRRGREKDVYIGEIITMDGAISTSAFDNLPKKMPSGNLFGSSENYIIVPKGTPMLFAEKVIGKLDTTGNNEDTYRGVRRQHEIILKPGTQFEVLKKDGYETQNILIVKEDK